jgi:hypothetical protein
VPGTNIAGGSLAGKKAQLLGWALIQWLARSDGSSQDIELVVI